MRRRRILSALALAGCVPAVAGCGSSSTNATGDRPPSPVMVSAAIDHSHVRLSPASVGAGPVQIVVANLTPRSQRLTFETAGLGAGIRSTATVGPNDTTQMQLNPRRGHYQLSVHDRSVAGATLVVGAARPSAQNKLLEP